MLAIAPAMLATAIALAQHIGLLTNDARLISRRRWRRA